MAIDRKLLAQHIDETDPLTALLKGHLWVEQCINEALDLTAAHPSELPDRAMFDAKLRIALAFEAINPRLGATLKALNRVRNKAAHRLEYKVSDEDVDTLIAAIDWDELSIVNPADPLAKRLSTYFNILIFSLETMNMLRAYKNTNQEVIQQHAVLVAINVALGMTSEQADIAARTQADPPPPPGVADIWPL
jgi:hypothetical protein